VPISKIIWGKSATQCDVKYGSPSQIFAVVVALCLYNALAYKVCSKLLFYSRLRL